MGRLDGKVALITGAARGQGRSHALAMAREGADIVAFDICEQIDSVEYGLATENDLKETVAQVEALDRRILGRKVDSRDQAQLDAAVAAALTEFGQIDVVAINHGIWTRGALWDLPEQTWQDTVDTNLTAVWKTLKAVSPHLRERRGGSVIITSSVNGVEGQAGSAHYTAAKHGALGLMKAAAMEFAPYRVRVNAVMPGFVDTNMTNWQGSWDMTSGHAGGTREEHEQAARHWHAFGGLMRPEDISGAVVFLASDESSRITGIEMPVDSGHLVLSTFNPAPPPE
ncbi:mycofactocin-coupled SDR family oxidoreductase [Pseudonocardia pini]|uniref:mycofactocin-coupled SDR family oxidoreductase n=1 Tax=Pseudonocardia pini TaxID=2758030 RepID=UPI0015EFDC36|nr:mycofactocin-coupled SDR family oxidoreductase [Pseudonocardia pini]